MPAYDRARALGLALLVAQALGVCALACASADVGPSAVTLTGQATSAPLLVSLERTSCYGWCPVYRVAVYEDGVLEFEGEHFVLRSGLHVDRVTPAQLAALREITARARVAELADRYVRRDYTDMPSIITVVRLGSGYKQVRHYFGDTSAPARLIQLEEEIDRVVEIERFIGTPAQREDLRASW
ncbi:MAG: hypothetical protein H6713_19295 [Myxococcales bacterium]|nr:hypothetical protein [Myxococcales bacterium]